MGNQLVLAFFTNEDEADYAVNEVKGWDKASKEVKLGAIGVLVKDDKGKIKTHKLGARQGQDWRDPLRPGRTPERGHDGLGGAVLGGILGSLFHKGLGLSEEDLARIDGDLSGGKAAVAILANADEAAARLREAGRAGRRAGIARRLGRSGRRSRRGRRAGACG